jgi:cytochrome c553
MKPTLIPFLLVMLSWQPALAESKPQPHSAGIEAKGYVWNKADKEVIAALKVQADPAKGKVAFEVCRGCHKADASGKADADYPQLAGQHATVLIKQMADVRAGRRDSAKMHPFVAKDVISTEELAHIAAYLNGLPVPTTNGKGVGNNLERGKALYDKDCASCHGASGEGDAGRFYPMVASQHYAYLYRENKAIQKKEKGRRNANPDMVKVIKGYSDADIAAVSDYMSRLTVAVSPAPLK